MFETVTIGDCTLYRGDALRVMADLSEQSIDAIITDPPYCSGSIGEAQRTRANGQGLRSENLRKFGWFTGDNMGTAGLTWLLRSVAVEARRLVKPTGSFLVFCDWRMLSSLQPAIESAGLRFQNLLVWDKGSMGLGSGFRCQHELIMHFTFGSPEYHDLGTANVLRCGRVATAEREHQTQKPADLLSELVKVTAPPGGRVLDPFVGSGSTVLACIQTARGCVGIENDPEYFALACRRIHDANGDAGLYAGADKPAELFTESPPV